MHASVPAKSYTYFILCYLFILYSIYFTLLYDTTNELTYLNIAELQPELFLLGTAEALLNPSTRPIPPRPLEAPAAGGSRWSPVQLKARVGRGWRGGWSAEVGGVYFSTSGSPGQAELERKSSEGDGHVSEHTEVSIAFSWL